MNLPSKISNCVAMRTQQNGFALPVVLFFTVAVLLAVTAFLFSQTIPAKSELSEPSRLQALFTARAGIWKWIDESNCPKSDTLKTINTMDSTFMHGMFDSKEPLPDAIEIDTTTMSGSPFATDSFGTCEVSHSFFGSLVKLESVGEFHQKTRTVAVDLGGKLKFSGDTVLYLQSGPPPVGGRIEGKNSIQPPSPVIAPSGKVPAAFGVNELRGTEVTKLVNFYTAFFAADTLTLPLLPLNIQKTEDLDKLLPDSGEVIYRDIFLNGVFSPIEVTGRRKIVIDGNLQVTGDVYIRDAEIIVSGDVKLFDKSVCKNTVIVANGSFWMQDYATFDGGEILSNTRVMIAGNSKITGKTRVVSFGIEKNKKQSSEKNSQEAGHGLPRINYQIFCVANASIDGVIVSLGAAGGVRIDKTANVKGIVWATGPVCLSGTVVGIICAKSIETCKRPQPGKAAATPASPQFEGIIKKLSSFSGYFSPSFLGTRTIIDWREQ